MIIKLLRLTLEEEIALRIAHQHRAAYLLRNAIPQIVGERRGETPQRRTCHRESRLPKSAARIARRRACSTQQVTFRPQPETPESARSRKGRGQTRPRLSVCFAGGFKTYARPYRR